jgi:hypothetical protein
VTFNGKHESTKHEKRGALETKATRRLDDAKKTRDEAANRRPTPFLA